MLGIQELDDLICLQLTRQDLAQCARVSKKWRTIVIPHLWRDLSWLSSKDSLRQGNARAFCMMVIRDFLSERERQKLLGHGNGIDRALSLSPPSPLSVHGHWIRLLPDPYCLLSTLRAAVTKQDNVPIIEGLVMHLFRRCSPYVRIDGLRTLEDFNLEPDEPKKTILDFSLPRLRRLYIRTGHHSPFQKASALMSLLDRCSTTLEELGLYVIISKDNNEDLKNQMEQELMVWKSLKELTLRHCADDTDTKLFWPWLLRRCSGVKQIRIENCIGTEQIIAEGMLAHMPLLDGITLGMDYCRDFRGMNVGTAISFLSGSHKGWKTMNLGPSTWFMRAVRDILTQHFSILETLEIQQSRGFLGNDLLQVLRSCNNLRTVAITDKTNGWITPWIDANVFADVNTYTDSLNPWKCEGSLKVLRTKIIGIPRSGLEHYGVIEETHPGQGRELQGRVYDRLARLINLETLWLACSHCSYDYQCLEMSLESGLAKLSGLKRLKELHIDGLMTRIGVKEVSWMTEHWPSLCVIDGLRRDEHEQVVGWLGENHPEITVRMSRKYYQE
ncbi:MAG: hypothetical protein J3Q66DRAFT_414469 [Benniella sp.]|nr:MAG: hypothetical protein J3Q66DRAFT_414469 [Benniella sp.]